MWTAFVTGCGSGFGHALARRLLRLGHKVVATDLELGLWTETLEEADDRLLCLPLDVRDDRAVADAVARAEDWGDVDVLVNNAGCAVLGTQEEADLEAVRDLFDVNVLGPARVTRALLPALRRNRGTVVQLSSIAGRTVFPESGFYAATKHALEAMSEALFQETCTFGVRVRLIQPGNFATRLFERAAAVAPAPPPDSPYAALRPVWDRRREEVLELPQDPDAVAAAILGSLADPAPFRRVPVGPDAARILALRDRLGADGWSRLAGDRAGLVERHGPGEVPDPDELLALPPDDPAWALALAACEAGHLGHWTESAAGRVALAKLVGA